MDLSILFNSMMTSIHIRVNRYLICLCLLGLWSCVKEADTADAPSDEQPDSGLVTAVGDALENPVTAMIGSAGGQLTSQDGQLTVHIPEGALASPTEVGIAAIGNTFEAAMGLNYRITPHIEFKKPVTLIFSYGGLEDSISAEGLMGICFQDGAGVWQLELASQLDVAHKQISVQTTHFSDWAVAGIVRLSPAKKLIRPEESVKIKPLVCIPLNGIDDLAAIFIPWATDQTIPLVKPYELPQDYVVDTFVIGDGESVEGGGTLTATGINSVIYTASSDVDPRINPVTVIYTLTNTPMVLQSKIEVIVNTTGVTIELDGKTYQYDDAYATANHGAYSVEFHTVYKGADFYGSLTWEGETAVGEYPWNADNTNFLWEPEGLSPRRAYLSAYNDGRTTSPGKITVQMFGDKGEFAIGEFSIAHAGATDVEGGDGEYLGDSEIKGWFMVRIADE